MSNPTRCSPIHSWLSSHGAQWGASGDGAVALRLGDAAIERAAAKQLALCDLSGLAKLGLKGPGAADWLASQGLAIPSELFEVSWVSGGGLLARHGKEEFFLEEGLKGSTVAHLSRALGPGMHDVYRVERHDGTFLLCGERANEVLLQTCGVNFLEAIENRVVFTRAAGVNCCILPRVIGNTSCFQAWVDPSYAFDFWHSFAEIVVEINGRVIGVDAVFSSDS